MCGELMEKNIDEILIGPYVGLSFPDKPLCEPTREQIDQAIQQKDFEQRQYQEDIKELIDEWNRGDADPVEYNRREQQYHARKIAGFAANGWQEPPVLKKDGRSVHDGLHRLKAAKHLGMRTLKVRILSDDT
jgi:hypothetical protein